MKPETQRIAIAEACGWRCVHSETYSDGSGGFDYGPRGMGPISNHRNQIPDYLNDLNAMHEVEMLLDDPKWTIPGTIIRGSLGLYDTYDTDLARRFGRRTRATAAQRAEAFLRTIGKWEDE